MKKIIALLMAVLMTVSMLVACSNTPAETNPPADETKGQADTPDIPAEKEKVTLKVWADQGELELIEKLCNEFAAAHTKKEYTFEYGAVGAVDGKTRYLEDPAAAADVFLFADDQLVDLVKADALYEVTRNTDAIIAANTPGSIGAASYEGTLYGYPMTSDNGYFLYYDKSVLTEEDLAMITSTRCFVTKLVMAVSGVCVAAVTGMFGYTPGAAQSLELQGAFHSMMTIVCAVIMLISVIPLFFYDLTEDKHAEIMAELAARKAQN